MAGGPMLGPIQGAIALLLGDGVALGCASTANGTSTYGGQGNR